MQDIILFLKETNHVDKVYVLAILILIFIGVAIALRWMSKKGIGFKVAGITLTPNQIKEIDDADKMDEKLKNLNNKIKIDKQTIAKSEVIEKDLGQIFEAALKANPELKKVHDAAINKLETQVDALTHDIEIKEAEIIRLEEAINKYTLDKTVDYVSFESCLKEITNEYTEIMKGVCYTFANDLSFSQIAEEEYNKLIRDNTVKFLKGSKEILNSKFSGEIIENINNLYKILTPKEEAKFESNYKSLYYSLRTLSIERENIKQRVLEKTGQQISSAFINWKRTLIPRLEDIERSGDSLTISKKINYLLQKDDILNLVAIISSIYNTYKEQDKTNIFKKQMELVDLFKIDLEYLIKINFQKFLIKVVEEEDIDITQHYQKD